MLMETLTGANIIRVLSATLVKASSFSLSTEYVTPFVSALFPDEALGIPDWRLYAILTDIITFGFSQILDDVTLKLLKFLDNHPCTLEHSMFEIFVTRFSLFSRFCLRSINMSEKFFKEHPHVKGFDDRETTDNLCRSFKTSSAPGKEVSLFRSKYKKRKLVRELIEDQGKAVS